MREHGLPDLVQTIRLAGGAIMGPNNFANPRINMGFNSSLSADIVGVTAYKDAIIAIAPLSSGIGNHCANDLTFLPSRDKDSDLFFMKGSGVFFKMFIALVPFEHPAEINQQIIDPKQHVKAGCKQQQFVRKERQVHSRLAASDRQTFDGSCSFLKKLLAFGVLRTKVKIKRPWHVPCAFWP